ncbi:MAG: hypothetical protein IIB00_00115 [candidate division Zixibacteria bacterium]|nr:hypothetical protein [candidate division Zixibacteria bacterium]
MPLSSLSPEKTALKISTSTLESELISLNASSLDLPELFKKFLDKIRKTFSLRRAVLFTSHTQPLRIVSLAMWNRGELSTGVAITIPNEDSLLAELIDTNCVKIISPVVESPGNFIESRLLLDHPGGALAIYPMVDDSNPTGIICLVSDEETAFFGENLFLKNMIKIFSELTRDHLPRYDNLRKY